VTTQILLSKLLWTAGKSTHYAFRAKDKGFKSAPGHQITRTLGCTNDTAVTSVNCCPLSSTESYQPVSRVSPVSFGHDRNALPLERFAHVNHAGGKTQLREFDKKILVAVTYGRNDRWRDPQAVQRDLVFVGFFVTVQ